MSTVGRAQCSVEGGVSIERAQTQEHCQVGVVSENMGVAYYFINVRLLDVLHRNLKLTMVFEYCDQVRFITIG